MKNKNIRIIKNLILILTLILLIGLIIYLFPIIREISTPQGQALFKSKISNSGIIGFLILFGLEVAQIFLFILPGEPLEILAGICYGGIGGTIFLLFSVLITTIIIFFLVKKYGKEFVYNFVEEKKINKIENSKLYNNPKKIEYILIILFMIPGTPKDFLVFMGGLLPIKPSKFILIATFARFPSIITSTLAGANIIRGNWMMMFIAYFVPIIIVAIIILLIIHLDKNGDTKEAIEIIK